MRISDFLGKSPDGISTVEEVQAADVSVQKDKRESLSTSDKIKLSKAARERESEKFAFFVTDGTAANDFKSVYDLQIQVDALITILTLYDMMDMFQVLSVATLDRLELCTETLIVATVNLSEADKDDNSKVMLATTELMHVEDDLVAVMVKSRNLSTDFRDVDVDDIKASNRYYSNFGADYVVENFQWSEDRILATCDATLRGKMREGLTGISGLERGGHMVLKMMLEVVMDVEDGSLRSMTEMIKTVRMKDIPGENMGVIASYLKAVIFLLDNCNSLPTDVLELLNDVMTSDDSKVFSEYMQSIYFAHTRTIKEVSPRDYVEYAEKEYRTLYCDNKWTAVKTDPGSAFYVEEDTKPEGGRGRGRGRGGGRGRGRGGGRENNRWDKCKCHNCGKLGHISRLCWLPGGGAHKSSSDSGTGGGDNYTTTPTFPSTDRNSLTRPP